MECGRALPPTNQPVEWIASAAFWLAWRRTARRDQRVRAYHTKTEPRPHREALSPSQAADLLGREARAGRLDANCVAAVLEAAGPTSAPASAAGRFNRARGRGSGSALQGAADQADRTRAGHSIKTADRQVLNAYAKIGVSTRVAATVFAMQHGLAAWGRTPNGWLRRSLLMSPVEHPGTRGVLPRKERAMNGSHGVELSGQDSVGESLGERLPAWVSGAAWAGIIGPVLFTAAFLARGPFRRGEYDPLAEPVSALQTGPTGWIQQLNFIVFGLLTIAFAIGLNRGLRPTRTGTVGPVLLFVSGIGLLHAAIFPRQYALPLEPMGQREKACVAPRKTDRPIVESH
jgi:hypothetical protein